MERSRTVEELGQEMLADLTFSDLFDLEEIQKVQDGFAAALGVASIITCPDGRPITRPSNFSRLCRDIIRTTEKGLANCHGSAAVLGRDNPSGPIMEPCPNCGLWDGGARINVGGKHIANWLAGQIRSEEQNIEELIGYAGEIGVDEREFRFALEEITIMPLKRFEHVCNCLFLMAGMMSKIAYQNASHAIYNRHIEETDRQLAGYRVHLEEMNRDIVRLDELKTELFANTSHELKTSLYNMISLAESLMDGVAGSLPQPAAENLGMVAASGRRMINLLNDTQDFSRLRHQDLNLRIIPVDMRTVSEVVIELFTPLLGSKDLKLINRIPFKVPLVAADESRVSQILQNMVGNAVKYCEHGTVTVSSEVKDDFLVVSVADTGSGIHEDRLQHVFESFKQADGSVESEFGGLRIGLGVSKLLVELQGGKIGVESRAGNGARFWFTLPLWHEKGEAADGAQIDRDLCLDAVEKSGRDITGILYTEPDSAGGKARSAFRLLVVDDEPVCLRVYSSQLEHSGYPVTQAVNAREALDKIEEADRQGMPFDLVLLDVVMPNMSGYEACRILRQKYPADRLPVLMLTAKDRIEDRVAGLEAGANDYLAKPFSRQELLARIHTHLTLKKLSDDQLAITEALIKAEQERRKLESQLRAAHKMEAIGTMAGGFAHDFNNILGIVLGNIELAIEDTPESNPVLTNLIEIRTACQRAKAVIRQIQSYTHQIEGDMKPVQLGPIVEDIMPMLRASIPSLISINLMISADNDMIVADQAQIQEVLVNLVNNAAFEMREDGGTLDISLTNVVITSGEYFYKNLKPGQYVRLTVRDTGKGIDPNIMDKIFDPYFTTKKIGEGSGMGLSVVLGIVQQHNGSVTVESEPGLGTAFHVVLPVIEQKSDTEITTFKEQHTGNERILLVDDEPSLARYGHIMLERMGYSVVSTTIPAEALNIFSAEPDRFDLLITDYAMPCMTGTILSKHIKEIRPQIPVILCTGFGESITGKKIKQAGISAVIMKPVDKQTFSRKIREVLDTGSRVHNGD